LYAVLCPYLNHFVASRRCTDKIRVGAKYVKKFEKIAKNPITKEVMESEAYRPRNQR